MSLQGSFRIRNERLGQSERPHAAAAAAVLSNVAVAVLQFRAARGVRQIKPFRCGRGCVCMVQAQKGSQIQLLVGSHCRRRTVCRCVAQQRDVADKRATAINPCAMCRAELVRGSARKGVAVIPGVASLYKLQFLGRRVLRKDAGLTFPAKCFPSFALMPWVSCCRFSATTKNGRRLPSREQWPYHISPQRVIEAPCQVVSLVFAQVLRRASQGSKIYMSSSCGSREATVRVA